jgi:hypothetical protein
MLGQIFGKPGWSQDERGVSHSRYTFLQGLEYVVRHLADRISALKGCRLMLVPVEAPTTRRNRMQWALRSFRIGSDFDYEKDEESGGFILRIELNDFGSVMEPGLWGKLAWAIDYAIPTRERLLMLACYTPEGYYIGDLNTAGWLYFKHGLTEVQPLCVAIDPSKKEEAIREKRACSIGFDAENQRWVGWSHRAICSFEVGYVAKDGDCVVESGSTEEYLKEHPEENLSVPVGFEVKTLEDSKRCAIAFAESIS